MRYIFDEKDWEELAGIVNALVGFLGRVSDQAEKNPRKILYFVKKGNEDKKDPPSPILK